MIAAYIFFGTIAGMVAFVAALLFGASLLLALMYLIAVGSIGLLAVPTMQLVMGNFFRPRSPRSAPGSTNIVLHQPVSEVEVMPRTVGEEEPLSSMRILAVDDDRSILELIPIVAAEADFLDVTTASSGKLALASILESSQGFDCILLDVNMPGMDGIELCSRIRQLAAYAQTPILMLTAMRETHYLESAFRAGATDFITKPFDIVSFNERLKAVQSDLISRQCAAATNQIRKKYSSNAASCQQLHSLDLVSCHGIDGFIEYSAMENYLTRLSAKTQESVYVMAIKIDQIETIYSFSSSDDFANLLKTAANAISITFQSNEPLIAYAGNGTFLLISGPEKIDSSGIDKTEIQRLLTDICLKDDEGIMSKISVSIGNQIRPLSGSGASRSKKTFETAISEAETLALGTLDAERSISL